jgi:uncharacterized membrane protein YoaK (UPF0700 family)
MLDKTAHFSVVLLAVIAGFVDAVGFITLGHIYTANMSGNSVAVGIQLAARHWPEMLGRIWPVLAYLSGTMFCRLLVQIGARYKFRGIVSVTVVCEIGLLLPVCIENPLRADSGYVQMLCVGLLASAMGIQNATVTKVQSVPVHTGFVTGMLLQSVEEFTKYLTWLYEGIRTRQNPLLQVISQSFGQRSFQIAIWLASIWVCYVAGACCGTLTEFALHLRALVGPLLGLLVILTADLWHPLGTEEEESQAKLSG